MGYFNEDDVKSRQLILDHYENPDYKISKEEREKLTSNYISFNNKSISCIDNLTVYLKIENDIVTDVKFDGIGCAISTASTDILSKMAIGKKRTEVNRIINEYFKMIEGEKFDEDILEYLSIFKGISKQLNRIKCAKVGVVAIKELVAK